MQKTKKVAYDSNNADRGRGAQLRSGEDSAGGAQGGLTHGEETVLRRKTEHTERAKEEMDWFKFETRIRKVILELLEPTANRSKDVDRDLRNVRSRLDKLSRRVDDSDYQVEKIDKKTAHAEDLQQQVRTID